jgi:hypothetical protein
MSNSIDLYFSDFFRVEPDVLEDYGAFNVSLIRDLPLFIDPFLLFESRKEHHRRLHDHMIKYLRFLKDKSTRGLHSPDELATWYRFSEVKQNWLGFAEHGNAGHGLGLRFARSLDRNLTRLFSDFGNEEITKGSHLEKLCLIDRGVGRDTISDFTTNLIKDYLLEYTQIFALRHISRKFTKRTSVPRAFFSWRLERWMPKRYRLPFFANDFVILTPKELLTRHDTWISYTDLTTSFDTLPDAVPDYQLRAEINNYFYKQLAATPKPTNEDRQKAIKRTLTRYPQLFDYYINKKERTGVYAVRRSKKLVNDSTFLFVKQFGRLPLMLQQSTKFYSVRGNTLDEARDRVAYLKHVIEDRGGWRIFYVKGQPIQREADIHILYDLVWFGTPSDVSKEVNDGPGPADFKISRGVPDKSIVEFKLASNTHLQQNLANQVELYKKASTARGGLKVIFFFTSEEHVRVQRILDELHLAQDSNVVVIDASPKRSASKR